MTNRRSFWDRASLRKQAVLTGHEASVRGLVFPAQPGLVATADAMATVRFWEIARRHLQESSPRLRTPEGDEYMLTGAALPPDLRWNVTSLAITRIGTHTSPINSTAFSPDGRQLLSGEHDGTVRLYMRHRTLWGFRLD